MNEIQEEKFYTLCEDVGSIKNEFGNLGKKIDEIKKSGHMTPCLATKKLTNWVYVLTGLVVLGLLLNPITFPYVQSIFKFTVGVMN